MVASSYSLKEVEVMHEMYTDNPCIEVVRKLAVLFNRPQKSIISKLSKEGIYMPIGYLTKTGKKPITKLQTLYKIERALDVKLPGLDKSPKATLERLETAVTDTTGMLEVAMSDLVDLTHIAASQAEMLKIKK